MVANAIGTLVVLGLVMVVNTDVVARGVFHAPFLGAVEVVQFSMVLIVFLQLPDVVRAGRLTRSDGLSCVFMALVSYAIWPEFIEMLETQDYFGVPGVFTAPWWPIKLVIFLGALLCTIIFALRAVLPGASETPETQAPAVPANTGVPS